MTVFTAIGGKPPYIWSNDNPSLGRLDLQFIPGTTIANQAKYTLIGAIPPDTTTGSGSASTDTVTLKDSTGTPVTATVNIIFAECTLDLSASTIDVGNAKGGETFDIRVTNGVAPFTATHSFPDAGTIVIDQDAGIVTFTVAKPPIAADPDNLLIRDSRGCVGNVDVTITPATPSTVVVTANPGSVSAASLPASVAITATVFDANNQPFEGVTILFNSPVAGTTLSSPTATTDANGQATVTLTIPSGTPPGSVTVNATAPGGATGSVAIVVNP
jgi:hypothetical protein